MSGELNQKERKALIQSYYNNKASTYGLEYHTSIAGKYFLKQKLKLLQEWAKIPTSSSILELGCANAVYTIPLKRLGYDIRGIDLAGDNIKESKRQAEKEGLEIDFEKGDIEDLGFIPENSVDAVLSYSTLRYVPDLEKALKEIYRVMKPGGTLLVDFANKWSPFFLFLKPFFRKYLLPQDDQCDIEHDRSEAYLLVKKAGFKDIKVKTGIFIARTTPNFLAYPFILLDKIANRIPLINRLGGAIFVKAKK